MMAELGREVKNMSKILLIEDDREICQMVKDHLEKYNYEVFYTTSGANGIEMVQKVEPILVLLDLMLPFVSGDEILKKIRSFSDVPIIVVSAKSMTYTKVEVLRLGADDYMTKPFDLDELLARIEANLKRFQKKFPELNISIGSMVLDTSSKTIKVHGEDILLTAREYQILELMMKYPDKVFSKKNLYESIWQEPFARDNDVINTHISNLRKKLMDEGKRIETVWGLGNRIVKREL